MLILVEASLYFRRIFRSIRGFPRNFSENCWILFNIVEYFFKLLTDVSKWFDGIFLKFNAISVCAPREFVQSELEFLGIRRSTAEYQNYLEEYFLFPWNFSEYSCYFISRNQSEYFCSAAEFDEAPDLRRTRRSTTRLPKIRSSIQELRGIFRSIPGIQRYCRDTSIHKFFRSIPVIPKIFTSTARELIIESSTKQIRKS